MTGIRFCAVLAGLLFLTAPSWGEEKEPGPAGPAGPAGLAGPAGPAKPALRLAVELSDGSRLIGTPLITSVSVQTAYAKMDIPLNSILSIKIEDDREAALLELVNGDKIRGAWKIDSLELEGAFGKVSIPAQHIRLVTVQGAFPSRGLALHLCFETDEGAKVTDRSGTGNDAAVQGAKWERAGRAGGAMRFDGANSHLRVADAKSLSPAKEVTIAAWVKLEKQAVLPQVILAKWMAKELPSTSYILQFGPNSQRATFVLGLQGKGQLSVVTVAAARDAPLGAWCFIAATYDGASIKVYMDGALSATVPASGVIFVGTAPVIVGAHDSTGSRDPFNGLIDEVMVFDRAVSADEIKQIYELGQ